MTTMRDDELSEKYFYAGCFGLPWLWIVHSLNYHSKKKRTNANAATLLGSEGNQVDEDPAQAAMALAEQQWVNRCRSSAIIVSIAWVAWVVVAQVLFTDIFPVSLYVRIAEQGEYTGW